MEIELRHLSEKDKKEICGWKYDGKYAMYNLPDYEEMRKEKRGFLNPEKEEEYCGAWEDGKLVGFVYLCPGTQKITIGLGVRPEFCGKHYGTRILKLVCEDAEKWYPGRMLCLHVRSWNQRAIKCYQNAGFHIEGTEFEMTTPAGRGMFYQMCCKIPCFRYGQCQENKMI